MYEKKPWLKYYGRVPASINYPKISMYEALMQTVERYPDNIAYEFMDSRVTYRQFAAQIDRCAAALAALGLKKGDTITIGMPTAPQGVICFYAANKLGIVSAMIHPLSTPKEIEFYLNTSKSKLALTLEENYEKFKEVRDNTPLQTLILTRVPDSGKQGTLRDPSVKWWSDQMSAGYPDAPKAKIDTNELAVILYSGGTTGFPKGIMLSNYNFISEGTMVAEWFGMNQEKLLAILPIFHGFGLGICLNACFMGGGCSILVPAFTPDSLAELIKAKKPTLLMGVPTLYDGLSRNPKLQDADFSGLHAAICGADSLPRAVKERFEALVQRQGGSIKLLEGYGLTEAVTGIMITPLQEYREGSIGVPLSDMLAKIVPLGSPTMEEADCGEEGEICVSGPAVMLGYLDNPEETAETLKVHPDGRLWLHTGDVGTMDEDGFFYFKLRQKRMIKSSGMNVYPAQVEGVLYTHPDVAAACVIGVPDETQVERVKAFVVLKDMKKAGPEMEKKLIDFCRDNLIKWSCPREMEFRPALPVTRVGKIAFNELEQEEIAKLKAAGKYAGG